MFTEFDISNYPNVQKKKNNSTWFHFIFILRDIEDQLK